MKAVIGIDFGTDSVRALIVNTENGDELASHVDYYPRWKEKKYCNADRNQWRQHPLDYIESMERAVKEALEKSSVDKKDIKGIAVDTTGSTPVAVDKKGMPLSLHPEFKDNPNAMFVLWKDHTALKEAAEINELCQSWSIDYSQFEGGVYSTEWYWSKILKMYRDDPAIHKHAYSWVEHCDWIPYMLTGGDDVHKMKRSRCAAGHKALWHPSWNGLPSNDFLKKLDPLLDGLRDRLYDETYTSDVSAGKLSDEWASRLGLSTETVVAVGAFDAHMGAVGGQILPYHLSKVMGTSTCDILVAPSSGQEKLIHGICGQVNGSVIPGMLGYEAGQSAFGDLYAWYVSIISDSLTSAVHQSFLDQATKEKLIQDMNGNLMSQLSREAAAIPIGSGGVLTLDWMNGRRTPDANQALKGVLSGLKLGNTSGQLFRSIIEASCYGARIIVERFIDEGIPIKGLIGLGGVAKKSPFIMQVMADVMNMPIKIARSEQTCALGAAMFAAVASGIHATIEEAMEKMGSGFDAEYYPNQEHAAEYEKQYQEYKALAKVMESHIMKNQ